jgi:hypothetical protein
MNTDLRTVRRIIYALHCLAPRFIRWPRDEALNRTIEEFSKARGFPSVIGALDGSYIKIHTYAGNSFMRFTCKLYAMQNPYSPIVMQDMLVQYMMRECLEILHWLITLRHQTSIFLWTLTL